MWRSTNNDLRKTPQHARGYSAEKVVDKGVTDPNIRVYGKALNSSPRSAPSICMPPKTMWPAEPLSCMNASNTEVLWVMYRVMPWLKASQVP